MTASKPRKSRGGAQRLNKNRLDAFRALDYGAFLHFGTGTFCTERGRQNRRVAPDVYRPSNLDVDQWLQVVRDAGMKYAILTTKHGGGFALWPSKLTRHCVSHSPDKRDVVELFVKACDKYAIKPVLYYAGEEADRFGDPVHADYNRDDREKAFQEYCRGQLEELLTGYGPVMGMWFDHPDRYTPQCRRLLYDTVAELQPEAYVQMNGAFEDNGIWLPIAPDRWPTDIRGAENSPPPWLVNEKHGWYRLGPEYDGCDGTREYYIPYEAAMQIDRGPEYKWMGGPSATLRSDAELLALRFLCRERNANCVFNIPPTPEGRVRQDYIDALMRLRGNIDQVSCLTKDADAS